MIKDVNKQTAPRFLARLSELHALLLTNEFQPGPDRWVALQDLLVRMKQEGRLPRRDKDYAPLFAPLFCATPEQQQTFYRLFDQWCADSTETKTTSKVAPQVTKSREAVAEAQSYHRQTRPRLFVVLAIALLGTLAVWSYIHYKNITASTTADPTPQTETSPTIGTLTNTAIPPDKTLKPKPIPPRRPLEPVTLPDHTKTRLDITGTAIPFIPALLALAWLLWRFTRLRIVLKRQRAEKDDPLSHIALKGGTSLPFTGQRISATFRRLRSGPPQRTRRLDIAHTVTRTVRNAGLFTPVHKMRRTRPDYLLLIDRRHAFDHSAALAANLAARLSEEGLLVHRYDFLGDPRQAFIQTRTGRRQRSLKALASEHGDARLLVTGDAESMFHPLTGEAQPWLADFDPWSERAWLTTRPQPWAYREAELAKAGFAIAPLNSAGIEAVGNWFDLPASNDDAPWYEPPGVEPYPLALRANPRAWLEREPPADADVVDLCHSLRRYLGDSGLKTLCVAAAYPELHWGLTLVLDQRLHPDDSASAREQRLLRLCRLPWFQQGRMPDYLREELLAGLDQVQRRQAGAIYEALFRDISSGGPGGILLPFAKAKGGPLRRLWRDMLRFAVPGSALDDRIFANLILGGRRRLLDFELPRGIASLLPSKRWQLGPILLACVVGVGSYVGLSVLWQEWGGAWLERRVEARILAQNSGYTVQVTYRAANRDLSETLRASLERWGFNTADPIPWPVDRGSGELDGERENRVEYATAAAKSVAQRVAARLQYLGYGDAIAARTQAGKLAAGLAADEIHVVLGKVPMGGEVFSDRLLHPYDAEAFTDALAGLGQMPEILAKIFRDSLADGGQGPDMIRLQAGTFTMGSPEDEEGRDDDEGPQHTVSIEPFAIGKYEVTFDEYDRFAEATKRELPDDAGWGRGKRPVINVSWEDAVAYAQWLSEQTGQVYRLPSEAEWEYAARGGSKTAHFWGKDADQACDFANVHDEVSKEKNEEFPWTHHKCRDGYAQTAPVGEYSPNDFGLHDILGNVYEWTQDCWNESYEGAPADGSSWEAENCDDRVIRGGSWGYFPRFVRSAARVRDSADGAGVYLGFRLARTLL